MDEEKKLSRREKKALKKAEKQQKPKMNPGDKKGIALVVVLSIVALVLLGNAVSIIFSSDKNDKVDTTATKAPVTVDISTTAVSTTAPSTTTPDGTKDSGEGEDKQTTKAEEPTEKDEKQEILDVVTNGVNALKASDASFTAHKEQVLDMQLTDCSVPNLVGIVNKIIQMFVGTESYDYDFTNGKGIDPETGEEITTIDTFPPGGKSFSLTIDGVASASKEQQGENTVYTVKLVPEQSTKDDPSTVHHASACDTLDLSSFELPMGEITKADLSYSGAEISVTLDKDGKVVGYHELLNTAGTGEAAAIGMTGGGTVEGYIDEVWTIQWK